jgi:hypothetical protein
VCVCARVRGCVQWRYLERNLRANGGIVDTVLLVTKNRDTDAGASGARDILTRAMETYPGAVKEIPFCAKAYGCAFDEIMVDDKVVYMKIDDDILFIKDGSFEHMAYQTLFNSDYTFFSGSVVNNPHSFAVHRFAGAYPPSTFHWKHLGAARVPFVNHSHALAHYYGSNHYDRAGSMSHEAFIYNAAVGRLDTYNFDVWNMHQCQCAVPQKGLQFCEAGYYRWAINAISFLHNVTSKFSKPIPKFDEPVISMGWASELAPHRVGIVGESLFVHCQVRRTRAALSGLPLSLSSSRAWS